MCGPFGPFVLAVAAAAAPVEIGTLALSGGEDGVVTYGTALAAVTVLSF